MQDMNMSVVQKIRENQVMNVRKKDVGGLNSCRGITLASYATRVRLRRSQRTRLRLWGCSMNQGFFEKANKPLVREPVALLFGMYSSWVLREGLLSTSQRLSEMARLRREVRQLEHHVSAESGTEVRGAHCQVT
jgi:hypothetical protein